MNTVLHVKYSLFLSDVNGTWRFSKDFRKMLKYHISTKIRSSWGCVFTADGRTDGRADRHDEANSRFSEFCERV